MSRPSQGRGFAATGRDGRVGRPVPGAGGEPVTKLVIVRHGAARCNANRVVGGHKGCTGLTDQGVAQVTSLADRLVRTGELSGASALYSSVLARAVETAQLLSPALGGLTVRQECGLCELHPGECDGVSWDEVGPAYGDPDFSKAPDRPLSPGGESWRQFLGRVEEQLRWLARSHRGETVVIAGHGGIIDGSLVAFLGVPSLGTSLDLYTSHASITEWEERSGRWRLARYNDHAHLVCQQE